MVVERIDQRPVDLVPFVSDGKWVVMGRMMDPCNMLLLPALEGPDGMEIKLDATDRTTRHNMDSDTSAA